MNMPDKLKPCPFCGNGAMMFPPTCNNETPYNATDRAYPIVRCMHCAAQVNGNNWDQRGKSAIEFWNTRRAPAPAAASLKRYRPDITSDNASTAAIMREDERGGWVKYTDHVAAPAPASVTVGDDAVQVALKVFMGEHYEHFQEMGSAIVERTTDEMRAALVAALESVRGAGDGWVACSEKMPEPRRYVLAWVPSRRMAFQSVFGEGYWTDIGGGRIYEQVTHWMRTPTMEAPTDKAREEMK